MLFETIFMLRLIHFFIMSFFRYFESRITQICFILLLSLSIISYQFQLSALKNRQIVDKFDKKINFNIEKRNQSKIINKTTNKYNILYNHSRITSKDKSYRYFDSFSNIQKTFNREIFDFELSRIFNVDPDYQRHLKQILLIGSHTSVGNAIKRQLIERNIEFAELKSIHELHFDENLTEKIFDQINIDGVIICYDPISLMTTSMDEYGENADKSRLNPIIKYIKKNNLKLLFISPKMHIYDYDIECNASMIYYPSVLDNISLFDTKNVLLSSKTFNKAITYGDFDGKITSITSDDVAKFAIENYFNFKPGSVVLKPNSEITFDEALKELKIPQNNNKSKYHASKFEKDNFIPKIQIENSSVIELLHSYYDNIKFDEKSQNIYVSFIFAPHTNTTQHFQESLNLISYLHDLYPSFSFEILYFNYNSTRININLTIPDNLQKHMKVIILKDEDCQKIMNVTKDQQITMTQMVIYQIGSKIARGEFLFLLDCSATMSEVIFELFARRIYNKFVLYQFSAGKIANVEPTAHNLKQFLSQPWLFETDNENQSSKLLLERYDIKSYKTSRTIAFAVLLSKEMFETIENYQYISFSRLNYVVFYSKFLKLLPGPLVNKVNYPLLYIDLDIVQAVLYPDQVMEKYCDYANLGYISENDNEKFMELYDMLYNHIVSGDYVQLNSSKS